MCGDRGPFLAAAAMVVMRLFSSGRLENWSQGKQTAKCHPDPPYVKSLNFRPFTYGGFSMTFGGLLSLTPIFKAVG